MKNTNKILNYNTISIQDMENMNKVLKIMEDGHKKEINYTLKNKKNVLKMGNVYGKIINNIIKEESPHQMKKLVEFNPKTDSLVMRVKSAEQCDHLLTGSEKKLVGGVVDYLNSISGVDVYLTGGILEKRFPSDIDMIAVGEKSSLDKIALNLVRVEMGISDLTYKMDELNFSKAMEINGLKDINVKEANKGENPSPYVNCRVNNRFKVEYTKNILRLGKPIPIDLSLVETSNFKTYGSK